MHEKIKQLKFIIPNIFTALSLISGLVALQFTFEGNFILASWLIAVSMFCDGLDGKLARLLKAQSKFGAQFDTLSDFVAFGVVPGFLAFKVGLFRIHYLGAIVAIFYVFAGGYRLVRFTLKNTDISKKHPFIGLPIPAAAGMISSYIILNFYLWKELRSLEIFVVIVFVSSVLMISKIEYLPIEKGRKISRETKFFIFLAIISVIASIKYSYLVFFIWMLIYVFYGIIRYIISALKK